MHTLFSNRSFIIGAFAAYFVVVLIIDLNFTFGVVGGVLYVLPLFFAARMPGIKSTILIGLICSGFALSGGIYNLPEGMNVWQEMLKRTLALFAIWMAVLFIIDRKKAGEKLRQSEERFDLAVKGSKDGLWDWNIKTNEEWWSPCFYELLGYDDVEIESSFERFQSMIYPEDKDKALEAIRNHHENHTPYDLEYRLKTKSGVYRWFRTRGLAIWGEDGKPVRMSGSLRDITEHKLEKASLNIFQHIVSSTSNFMSYVDKDLIYREVNDVYLNTFDKTRDEIVGHSAEEIFGMETFENTIKPHFEQCLSGLSVNFEELLDIPNKGPRYLDVRYDPHTTEDGSVQGVIISTTDITESKLIDKALKESEARFRGIFEQAAVGVALVNTETGRFERINQFYCDMVGYDVEELSKKMTFQDITHPDDLQEGVDNMAQLLTGEIREFTMDKRYYHKDGSIVWVSLSVSPTWNLDEKPRFHIAVVQDITKRKQSEVELQKLSRAVDASSSAVIITDVHGHIEYVNPRFTTTTGYTREEVMGLKADLLQSGETPKAVYTEMWKTILSGKEWKGELRNRKKDGSLYWDRVSISGVKDATEDITHFIAIQNDVTHEYELGEQLTHQASHDALTGLINRREFERRAERLLSTLPKDDSKHALCFMDLDQFKVVNDTCGHIAGDEMLRQLATVLQKEVRKRDTLARLGGDEFGVLMEHCSLDHAHRVSTSLQKAIQDYQFFWEGHVFKVGVSIGLVAITGTIPSLTELLKEADAACYMAKDLGRNRIHIYHKEDEGMTRRHGEMQWVPRLHQALEDDRFCLYAQAIVPLDRSQDRHYELLLRMEDEKGKIIPPGAFLPAAERYNLITHLDTWVIENAFRLLVKNPVFLTQIQFISINLSGQSLTTAHVLNFIISQLEASGIEANKVCFEITETAAITNLSMATGFISTLRKLGCRFALDDFGSGLSSFAYLKNLSVDYLKIDGMFVKDITNDPIGHAMVKSINEIGHVMGMQTIAEFVENDEIKGMLKEIGVNYAQGYGIAKPLPFDELLDRSNSVVDIKNADSDN